MRLWREPDYFGLGLVYVWRCVVCPISVVHNKLIEEEKDPTGKFLRLTRGKKYADSFTE